MHVDPVGAGNQAVRGNQAEPPVNKPGNGNKTGQAGGDAEATVLTDAPSKGVIRLLEAGHFKGVAAARLTINFQEELGALSAAKQSAAVGDGLPGVEEAVTVSVNVLLEADGVTEEQSIAIQDALSVFADAVGAAGGEDDPIGSLQAAFDSFVQEVRGILELDVEPTPPAEGEEPPPPSPFIALVADIESAFDDALASLQSTVDAVGAFDFGEPNGNGVAFQKFLNILQGLQETEPAEAGEAAGGAEGVESGSDSTPDINSIDQNI